MGLSASKRVKNSLSNSAEFGAACDSTFSHCLSVTQHAFDGVFPYQLCAASDHLHHTLTAVLPHPLIVKWVPSPPTRVQVDSALRAVSPFRRSDSSTHEDQTLGPAQFKSWSVHLFTDAVTSNIGKEVLYRVPIGIAGIAGLGAVTRSGKELVGAAIGVYALGVATSFYLGLCG